MSFRQKILCELPSLFSFTKFKCSEKKLRSMSCASKVCNPLAGDNAEAWVTSKASPEVKDGLKALSLDNDALKKEMGLLLDNIKRGLAKSTHDSAIVKCFPTYVQDLPDGTCTGKFLALDLGGTNFRVLLVELDGGKCDMKSKVYAIPVELMTGSGLPLFDHIADCLHNFAEEKGVADANLPLGFTFSFPLAQRGLCVGILERWTKGFNCPDVVGKDVVQLLNDAIAKRGDIKIDVCAVLNDTTGTLMSCAWKYRDCRIGLIVGTGNNGCYYETQANAELFDEPDMGSGKVIINLEMGAFGDDGCLDFIRTDIDKMIDEACINPGKQQHEKLISGMYLGELVRLYALRFTEKGWMFSGNPGSLTEREKFLTNYISDIESDPSRTFSKVRAICNDFGLVHATEQDYINLRYICQATSTRAAYLSAAACVTLIHKMDEKKLTIGVDGSVYKFHPFFRKIMINKMNELINPGYTFDVVLSEDGSGRGAALVAAVAARKKREQS